MRAASSYDAISFHAENAEQLLGKPVSDELKADFVLAEQIAPVLALCAEGNPRQTKRFLNALVLRIDMATDRGVSLDRATAAKLLLLEYFLPDLFRTLALARRRTMASRRNSPRSRRRRGARKARRSSRATSTHRLPEHSLRRRARCRRPIDSHLIRTEPMLECRPAALHLRERALCAADRRGSAPQPSLAAQLCETSRRERGRTHSGRRTYDDPSPP